VALAAALFIMSSRSSIRNSRAPERSCCRGLVLTCHLLQGGYVLWQQAP
jgi:hypothetical protein